MCLQITSEHALIADKDIVCYKILRNNRRSPYQDFLHEKNVFRVENRFEYDLSEFYDAKYGFHSFSSYWTALSQSWFSSDFGLGYTTCKFIIPKGSYYYEGVWSGKKGYCSNQIKMV